jgi:hypothetical protein
VDYSVKQTNRLLEPASIALKKVTLPTALQVGAQLLRQGGQHRHVTAGLSLGLGRGPHRGDLRNLCARDSLNRIGLKNAREEEREEAV